MSSGAPSVDREEGPPRKRIRKGTKSCWECKRRKVRCQLSSEDVPVCSGCLARGSTCLSQEYPEERDASGSNQIGERLGRVEHLLETIVAKMSKFEDEEDAQKILTPESSNNDILTPFPANASSKTIVLSENYPAPILSLFDNTVLGLDNTPQSMNTPASPAGTKTPSCVVTKKERIRRALSELLPSQKDADLIFAGSGAWLLVHTLTFESDSNIVKSIFDLESIREGSAVKISRTLLYFAVMLQQLDSDFDARQLQMYPAVDARMERYISTVQSLVASDDELMASMAGLECLVLIGLYQMNAGNPRRSWLVFRRCMNIGQLLGIDRKGASNIPTGKEVWYQIVQIERYLCLLLGLPAGCADPELDVEDSLDNPAMTKDTFFRWKVCNISSRIIERNQASASMLAYASTQNIDEQLDSLAKEVGPDWWAIPNVIPNNRSKESAAAFDRLMSQIWFFQLESLLHLPFMLRASTERRFEYSKFSCFKASREVMYRYLLLRSSDNKAFCCNVVDFGALTSAVTLFLGLLEADNGDAQEKQREADRALIQMVLAAMEELATDRKDVVAMQSVNVIKALLAFNSSSTSLGLAPGANFKLTIPYFGTITIARSQTSTPQQSNGNTPTYFTNGTQQQQQRQPLSINHQLPSGNWPGFTFTPSFPVQNAANGTTAYDVAGAGLYGPLEGVSGMGDWGLGTADTMFFDSLLSTDIEGNWVL